MAMRKKPTKDNRKILLFLFVLSLVVAILSLFEIDDTAAAILLGSAAVIYLIIRVYVAR
jgi:hypothetical protein